MSLATATATAIAWLLVAAVLLSSLRMLWQWRRPATRPAWWRAVALLLGGAVSALLLYRVLFPPAHDVPAGRMIVLTAAAPAPTAAQRGERVIALPEAASAMKHWPDAERMPDLATALRRHPGTGDVLVIGNGLVARDRPAATGVRLQWQPAPLPRGLVELQAPARATAGRSIQITGRVHGVPSGSIELLDPAGQRLQHGPLDDNGGFRLDLRTRQPGLLEYRLRVLDASSKPVEQILLPMQVQPAPALRALALAGAPNAELKFLRRWASDAGITLDARIELGGGLHIGSAGTALDAGSLARLDLLLVDERSWQALGSAQRAQVLHAVDAGLGLLLRMTAGATGQDPAAVRALGLGATAAPRREVRLGAGFTRSGDAADTLPPLTRTPLQLRGDDAVVAVDDAAGNPLALWRPRGAGRIGVAVFDDSYRLALARRNDAYGELWSRLFDALARPLARDADARIEAAPPNQRSVLCGLRAADTPNATAAQPGSATSSGSNTPAPDEATSTAARVQTPDGQHIALLIDPRSGHEHCAGFWATTPGWHQLQQGARAQSFHVPSADNAPALQAQVLQQATAVLVANRSPGSSGDAATATAPGARWPWFLAWLALAAALWWLERSRFGRPAAASGSR